MLTFYHAATCGQIADVPLPSDMARLILMHAIARHRHAQCHDCCNSVLVERLDAWITPGQRIPYAVRNRILTHKHARRYAQPQCLCDAKDLVLNGAEGVAIAHTTPDYIRVGNLRFENRFPQLYQLVPYHVVDGRFICSICRFRSRRLLRILLAWRSVTRPA